MRLQKELTAAMAVWLCASNMAALAQPMPDLPASSAMLSQILAEPELFVVRHFEKAATTVRSLSWPRATPANAFEIIYLSSSSTLSEADEAWIVREYMQGRPVLVELGAASSTASRYARLFGVSVTDSATLLQKGSDGDVSVRVLPTPSTENMVDSLSTMLSHPDTADTRPALSVATKAGLRQESTPPLTPRQTFNISYSDPEGEVNITASVSLLRSATISNDDKYMIVKTTGSLRPLKAGITDGNVTGENLWGAYLPTSYVSSHALHLAVSAPTLVEYDPFSTAETDFNYTKEKVKGFSIGGTVGGEGGGVNKAPIEWSVKSPFKLDASYTYTNREVLGHSFKDYSLQALPLNSEVTWTAPIANRFDLSLLARPTASLPILMDSAMTPMMRTATMQAYSEWRMPGQYNGEATLRLEGGYSLSGREWRWKRATVETSSADAAVAKGRDFIFDMSHPFLEREAQVLIQSAFGPGKCIANPSGATIAMQDCLATDPAQIWGLDSERRYRNHRSRLCLAINPSNNALIAERCALNNCQQWEWRADRVHSAYNLLWRLYVTGSQGERIDVMPDTSMLFENIPLNAFQPLNIPWSSYPAAPSMNDVMPNLGGVSPVISPDWLGFHATDAKQRWRVTILRQGINQ